MAGKFAGWAEWLACGRCAQRARSHGAARVPPGMPRNDFLARIRPPPEPDAIGMRGR